MKKRETNHSKYIYIYILIISTLLSCKKSEVIFFDDFSTRGPIVSNVIQLPPPEGLGYTWEVLEKGFIPEKWVVADELPSTDPKKGFWVIHPDSGYLVQAGRSHNSILFANCLIPKGSKRFDISFSQYRNDNDYIGYILSEDTAGQFIKLEFGYMTQVPGTDSTTNNAYTSGSLGDKIVFGAALMHKWASHLISVREDSVKWFINNQLIAAGDLGNPEKSVYFGIRQRYERGTRYEDVRITAYNPFEKTEK